MKKYLVTALLLLLLFTSRVQAECNACSNAGIACVSGTQFQVCVLNVPTGNVITCPAGTVCSTAGGSICQGLGPTTIQACQDCNTCDATNTFACTSATTFALCLGTTTPSEELGGTCDPNYVCNINYPFICGSPASAILPTCSSLTATTTAAPTTATPLDPTAYCRIVRRNSRFPVGVDLSTTCRQYIYCFLRNGFWYGQLYNCAGSTFFDSSSKYCVNFVPARCSTVVQSLSVGNIQLL